MAVSLSGTFRLIDRASPELRMIRQRAQAADRALEKLGHQMDRVAAREQVQKIGNVSQAMRGLEGNTNRVERAMGRTALAQDKNTTATRRHTSEMSKLETVMRKVVIISTGFMKVLAPAKFGLILAVIKPLVGAVGSLVAGASALVQQLVSASAAIVPLLSRMGSLAGLGAAAATAFISLKAATLTVKFAMHGVQQAIAGNAAAFKKLTPEAKAFVSEMKKLKPLMNELRASAQKGLFPGLTGAIRTARQSGGAGVASQALGGIGSAVGGVAQGAASRFTSPAFLRDLSIQFGTIDVVIKRLGGTLINVVDAFHNVLFAAQPLTRWLTATILAWSKYLVQQTQIARETGRLGAYFSRTRATLTALGHIVRDFGMGFLTVMRVARGESGNFAGSIERIAKAFRTWTEDAGNQARMALYFQRAQESAHRLGGILVNLFTTLTGIGKASSALGTSMTGSMEKTTKRWSDFANSFQGQSKISTWMNGMRKTLGAIWGLIAAIGGAFARMSSGGGGATGLVNALRGMLPDIERVLNNFSKNVAPALFGAIGQLVHLFASIATTGASPLGIFLGTLNSVLAAVNGILDRFRLVKIAIAGAFLVIGGAFLMRKLAGIVGGVGSIAAMWARVTGATIVATEAAAAYGGVAMGGGAVRGGGVRAVPGGSGLIRNDSPAFIGPMPGYAAKAGMPGFIGPMAPRAGLMSRAGGILRSPIGGMGLAMGVPALLGVGAQIGQSSGLIGAKRAGQLTNVATMAGTGAMLGMAGGPAGMAIGAGLGAGAGLLMNAFGPHDSAEASYAKRFGGVAQAHGFDSTVAGGGAKSLAGEERYQHLLDRSLTTMRAQRAEAVKKYGADSWGAKAITGALDKQIAANQVLRGQNIAKLGIDRASAKALREQTAEINKQARARAGHTLGAKTIDDAGLAYSILRKGGLTEKQATDQIVRDTMSRAHRMKNPTAARSTVNALNKWLTAKESSNPALKGTLDAFHKDAQDTMKKLGVTVFNANGKILTASVPQWIKIKQAMTSQAEQARQQVSTSFTQMQQAAKGILVGMGYSPMAATAIIQGMEGGAAGPTGASLTPKVAGPTGAFAKRNALTGAPAGARGMRIPGSGKLDTVPIGGATGIGAPGELVVNRHTERRVNRLLAAMGTSLGKEVAGETKAHSDTDILPGLAKGGRLGRAIREANRIDALRSKYLYGGGHVTPAPGNPPWDCSSSTSRVLQVAGYNVPTQVSGDYMKWGLPGPGPIGISASPGHVFMVLNGRAWGTSHQNPGGGPGWISGSYRPGFTTRHAPGAGGGGVFGLGPAPMMPAIPFGFVGAGLGGVPAAAALGGGRAIAAGLQGKISAGIAAVGGMAHGGRIPAWGGWKAGGMDAMVHGPTMIGVGERGPERVTVTPSGGRGGGGITIQAPITIYAYHPGDVRREVEAALLEAARAIDRAPTVGGA